VVPAHAHAAACTAALAAPSSTAPLPGSCFEGYDGDQVDSDGTGAGNDRLDWQTGLSFSQHSPDFVMGASDSQFTSGTEENPDSWGMGVGSLGSDKYNMIDGWLAFQRGLGDQFVALALVRESNNGTSWLAFELNQSQPGYRTETEAVSNRAIAVPTRSSGDLLITYSISNNNSPKPVIGMCKWVGNENAGIWANQAGVAVASNCPALGAGVAQADMNSADIAAASNFLNVPASVLQAGTFGEASINLTEAMKAGPDQPAVCATFSSFWMHSRSSEPVTSAGQDYLLPAIPIDVSSCPAPDADADGVPDASDACPSQSDAAAPRSPRDGCPADPASGPGPAPEPGGPGGEGVPQPTNGDDVLTGDGLGNTICGLLGNDTLSGGSGDDTLFGDACNETAGGATGGNDVLNGEEGNDSLYGAGGRDSLEGGGGRDRLSGGDGNDRLIGGPGVNKYRGGAGKDALSARNRRRETVDCGKGKRDTATVDRADVVKHCETVRRPSRRP
jgi:hypothetical protein